VESDVLVVSTLADSLVADLFHIFDKCCAVTSSWLPVVETGVKLGSVLDSIAVEVIGTYLNGSSHKWVSSDVIFLLNVGVVFLKILTFNLFAPDGEISNDFSGVGSFLILRLLFLNSDVDTVSLQIFEPKCSGVHTISGLHSSEDAWLHLVELGVGQAEGLSFLSNRVL
jgi:hypothetical protein